MAVPTPPVHGSPEYLRLLDESGAERAPTKALRLLTIDEVLAIPKPDFLIEDVLPVGSLAELHGPPGGGKTFLAIDMALSVASGRAFFGRTVRKGRVVYVIAEGQSGMGIRYRAWMEARGASFGIDLETVPEAIQLMEPASVQRLIDTLAIRPEKPALIVLDTLARCFLGGEENSAKDMGLAIAAADKIRHATGGSVLLVHHTRKDGDVERGSIALRGGVDTMLSLKEEDSHYVLTCEKQKDADTFQPIAFRLHSVGDSLVVMPPQAQSGPSKRAYSLLETLSRDFPGDGATTSEWSEASGMPRASFYRARGELIRDHLVAEKKEGNARRYRPTPDGQNALVSLSHESLKGSLNARKSAQGEPDGAASEPPFKGVPGPGSPITPTTAAPLGQQGLSHSSLTSQPSLMDETETQALIDERRGMREP